MSKGSGNKKTPQRIVELLRDSVNKSSQSAVAKSLGIGVAAVNRYINGIGEPTYETLEKLAKYFKVSVGELRGIKGIADIDLNGDEHSELYSYYNLVSATKNLLNAVLSEWPEADDLNRKATLDLARSIIVDVGGHDEKYLELAEVAMEVVRRSVASRKN